MLVKRKEVDDRARDETEDALTVEYIRLVRAWARETPKPQPRTQEQAGEKHADEA